MKPTKDPNSTKYPDRVFYRGRWRTPEQIEWARERNRAYKQSEKGRERSRAYKQSEKGRERNRAYEQSEKGRERRRRYQETHIQVRIGGINASFKVRSEKRAELIAARDEFLAQQRAERMNNGGNH